MAIDMYDFTREYYRVPVTLTVAGFPIDPTALTVEFALMIAGTKPSSGDWKFGDWETGSESYLARVLVGDALADFVITGGTTYDMYWRLSDTPERPARLVGQINAL